MRGKILSSDTRVAVTLARITLSRVDHPGWFIETDAETNGAFEFIVPSKPMHFQVEAQGFKTWTYERSPVSKEPPTAAASTDRQDRHRRLPRTYSLIAKGVAGGPGLKHGLVTSGWPTHGAHLLGKNRSPVLRQDSVRTENSVIPCRDGCLIQVIPSSSNAKNPSRGTRAVYLYI